MGIYLLVGMYIGFGFGYLVRVGTWLGTWSSEDDFFSDFLFFGIFGFALLVSVFGFSPVLGFGLGLLSARGRVFELSSKTESIYARFRCVPEKL